MSRLLNRTFIFVSFAISLCSASPEVTSTCRDGEPGQDECKPAVPSSLMQKAIKTNHVRPDSASEAVRADESVFNKKITTTVGVKVAMSFWQRYGSRKHGLRSMFMSTTGHETQLKSKSFKLAGGRRQQWSMLMSTTGHETQLKSKSFKLNFASKSERNQSQVNCPMCGEQNDNASCMALCGTACSEDGTNCTECCKENGCMDCLECARGQVPNHEGNHEDKHEDMCPMCGKEDDNASCMALCAPSCSEEGANCTECAKENGCMDCLECHVAHKHDHEDNHESRRPDNSEKMEDFCPMCHKPGAQLCAPTCGKSGVNSPDCSECCKENGCTDCLECVLQDGNEGNEDMTNEDKVNAILEWADKIKDMAGEIAS